MPEKKGAYRSALERIFPIIEAAHKAKKYSTWEMRKISSAKRCRKWRQINTAAIKEYHAWIGEELKWQKKGGGVNARSK